MNSGIQFNYTKEYGGYHDMCRNCGHAHWQKLICCVIIYNYGPTGSYSSPITRTCGCERWAPKDNLKFLEYEYERSIK